MPTPREVAQWMLEQLEQGDELMQQDAARAIQKDFGQEFVYNDKNGDLAVDRRVLYQFKKLSGDTAVWVACQSNWLEGFWRIRESGDKIGRKQYLW